MAAADSIWAIDSGNNSLKALHLAAVGNAVQVIGFDNIQHGKILSGSGIKTTERDELVAISLRKLVQRNDLSEDSVVISVPSQNSFARFVNLPPVEANRIPEIVKFEAAQQIPFDINEVQWDWQLMTEAGSDEKKVGIFAIKNEVVDSALEHFGRENVQVGYVQMSPMALYNYLLYDRPDLIRSENRAIVVLNIGAENTDLVVCTKSLVWQRCILIGGNAFTKAIADTFKLNFEKAEKLKRTAPVSKYARQIFQAMRPVFTDLASEVQRSLGFYTSSNPNTNLSRIIALGGGTKLRGLLKYLQQTLQIPVEKPDAFKKLAMGSGVSAAKFHENIGDFGVVYGLALQGLGLAKIESNLLPRSMARSMAWAGKGKYFIAAAGLLLLVSLMCLASTSLDKVRYNRNSRIRQRINSIINDVQQASTKLQDQKAKSSDYEVMIQKEFEAFKHRELIPLLYETILSALPNEKNNPEQRQLYQAFASGDVEAVLEIPRKEREQLFITNMSIFYTDDLATADFGSTAMARKGAMRGRMDETDGRSRGLYDMDERYMEGMPQRQFALRSATARGQSEVVKEAGFVVTIAGYSPYKDIGELLYPPGVKDEPNKWGFVTRLLHLDDIVDGNSPFELFKITEAEHFKLDKGQVDLDADMPAGIGTVEFKSAKPILVDPMTKEVINKVAVLDEYGTEKLDRTGKPVYQINDYWFILNVKFIWKDAPKQEVQTQDISIDSRGRPIRVRSGSGGRVR